VALRVTPADNESMNVIPRPPTEEVLGPQACLELLRCKSVGRVAITLRALPVVVPIRYAILRGTVVFKTTKGSSLATATADSVVAFEVDHHDEDGRSGWSVMVQGRSRLITDLREIEEACRLDLECWSPEQGLDYFVRIRPEFLTGTAFG
jgi:nitroimidazol reductase NimA-like FMN-containing flavoprotein (pyridoxamine 5'-phosphate oxidase superfamily)